MNRFKSPVLWSSLSAILFLVMANYGLYELIGMPEGTFREIINIVLAMCGIVGVANNPTNEKGW